MNIKSHINKSHRYLCAKSVCEKWHHQSCTWCVTMCLILFSSAGSDVIDQNYDSSHAHQSSEDQSDHSFSKTTTVDRVWVINTSNWHQISQKTLISVLTSTNIYEYTEIWSNLINNNIFGSKWYFYTVCHLKL